MSTVATLAFQATYHGSPAMVAQARHAVAAHFAGSPVADDMALICSELATNSIQHSDSAGGLFSVRAELHRDYGWLEVEDYGGTWQLRPSADRPRGLDVVNALCGADNWGVEPLAGWGRVVWARVDF
ncbi:MAG: ATP-binding protein [Trebonia sp.]